MAKTRIPRFNSNKGEIMGDDKRVDILEALENKSDDEVEREFSDLIREQMDN